MKTSLASELAGGIAYPTLNSPFTKPGVVFVGQAIPPAKPASGLFSSLRVLGKLLKLDRIESHCEQALISFRRTKPHHNKQGCPMSRSFPLFCRISNLRWDSLWHPDNTIAGKLSGIG